MTYIRRVPFLKVIYQEDEIKVIQSIIPIFDLALANNGLKVIVKDRLCIMQVYEYDQ